MSIPDDDNDNEQDVVRGRGHPERLVGGSARKPARLGYMDDIPARGHESVLDQVIARENAAQKRALRYATDRQDDRSVSGHETRGKDSHELPLDVELGRYEQSGGRSSAADDVQLPGRLEHRLRKANGGKQRLTAEERRKQHLNMPDGSHNSR